MTTEVEEVTTEPLTARDLNLTILNDSYDDICLLIIDPQVIILFNTFIICNNYALY
jgi:hypothetical protein